MQRRQQLQHRPRDFRNENDKSEGEQVQMQGAEILCSFIYIYFLVYYNFIYI